MEHEGIFEGDFVIVQPYPNGRFPKQRELIVTLYLPPTNETETEGLSNLDDSVFEGPTIKYFTDIPGNRRPYRLRWRRGIDKSEYTIETKIIRPIGRVVGVYRALIKP
jgi:hypothetical protein